MKGILQSRESYYQILTDPQGNYFFKELLPYLSLSQRLSVLEAIGLDFITIATHNYGTHSIQKLILSIHSLNEVAYIINHIICGRESELAYSEYGYFILQKLLELPFVSEDDLYPIFEWMRDNFMELATNANPLSVVSSLDVQVKRGLARFISYRSEIIPIIEANVIYLAQHEYGNYAI